MTARRGPRGDHEESFTKHPREGAGASAERSNGKRRAPSGATGGPSSELEKEILSSTCASWRGVGELACWQGEEV